jgi:anaerobic magnesium-protoporphyrin IX monomethyl ester cyclase
VKVEQVQRAVEMSRARNIQSGMFLMWGYEGEEMEDIEATIRHVSRARPDIFFTTVSYPIKGTPYYQQVQSKLVQLKPWAQTSDRELRIAGRHSRKYYAHADKLLRDEVQLAKLSEAPGANSALLDTLRVSIRASRDGLLATQSEVEA